MNRNQPCFLPRSVYAAVVNPVSQTSGHQQFAAHCGNLCVAKNGDILQTTFEEVSHTSLLLEEPPPPVITDHNNFSPEYRFLHLVKPAPFTCLAHVFDSFTLSELSEMWKLWTHSAICAEYSAFSEETDRRYLLQFADDFDQLIEALHYSLVKAVKQQKVQKVFPVNKKNTKYKYPGKKNTGKTILHFARSYKEKQVKRYLWSVLDCVLTDGKSFGITSGSLLFEYEALLSIGRIPFYLIKQEPHLFEHLMQDAD